METITPTEPSNVSGARGTFLTVLCILTFIGSGWGVIKGITNYIGANSISAVAGDVIKDTQDKMDDQDTPSFAKQMMSSAANAVNPDTIRKTAILTLLSSLLTLLGALMMWRQKKVGFYLYIVGTLVLIATPLVMGSLLGAIGAMVVGFIGVIFIVLYGVNLKYMNQ